MTLSLSRRASIAAAFLLASAALSPAHASATRGKPNPECARLAPAGFPFPASPVVAKRAYHACYSAYSAYVDPETRGPLWSFELLQSDSLQADEARTNDFRPDPDIPASAQAKSQKDFARSGYDQGHMAPAGDFHASPQVMSESFFYSNIVPQNANNNRNAWQKLEIFTRQWAHSRGSLTVVTGPIFSDGKSLGFLGSSKLAIPTHIFKVIIDHRRMESMAFVLPNQPIEPLGGKGTLKAWEQTLAGYQVSIKDVEAWSGLAFDPALPAPDREKLHSQKNGMWSTRSSKSRR